MSASALSESDRVFAKKAIREAFPETKYGSAIAAQCAAFKFFVERKLEKKMTLRRVRTLWEGTGTRVDGEEKDALRQAKIEEARNEYKALRSRLASLEAALAAVDQDFHGPQMDAYRTAAGGMGRGNCTRNHD